MAITAVMLGLILVGIADGLGSGSGTEMPMTSETTSDGFVRNFKAVLNNGTQVTFSWDIQSGYHHTNDIDYFRIYYTLAYPGYGSSGYWSYVTIPTSSTTQTNGGLTFSYSITFTSFENYAQYIMWLYVDRDESPYTLYSEQIYVEIGTTTALEFNIKLIEGQTCLDFTSRTSTSTVGSEIYRAIRIYCQCTYDFIRSIRIVDGYFECSTPGYVTYRAYMVSSDATKNPSTLVRALRHWLRDTNNNTIIAGGRKYRVEPGPCGLTVPYTNAPFCADNTPTTAAAPSVLSAQSNNVGSNQTTPPDNTAVIVASVFAVMFFLLALGLLAYIMVTKRPARRISKPATGTAGNTATTNPYLASTIIPMGDKQLNTDNIELESDEEADCNETKM